MSPEQAQGRATGPQSDLYSLGIVMYEALTGTLPFTGKTAAEVAAKHVQERVPALHLRNVTSAHPSSSCRQALMRDLSRRYRGANEMLMDLEKLADGIEFDQTGALTPSAATRPCASPPDAAGAARAAGAGARSAAHPEWCGPPFVRGLTAVMSPRARQWRLPRRHLIGIVALVLVIWLVKLAFYPTSQTRASRPRSPASRCRAEDTLRKNKLTKGRVDFVYEDDQLKGVVVQQSPRQPRSKRRRDPLHHQQREKQVTVPDVVGAHRDAAQAMLIGAGLVASQRGAPDDLEGHCRQPEPRPRANLDEGTAIDLEVSKA